MKLSRLIVASNPPYQKMTGGGAETTTPSASPIYQLFIETMLSLTPDYFTFITPSRWMIGGRGLDAFREKMIQDTHFEKMTHFPGESEVFTSVRIQGGVSYFLYSKNYDGPCEFTIEGITLFRYLNEYDIVLLDNRAKNILDKVLLRIHSFLSDKVSTVNPFGISSTFSDWTEEGTPCYARGKKMYCVSPEVINDKYGVIDKWNVCIPTIGDPRNPRVFHYTVILPPGTVCTDTCLVVSSFETKMEAESFESYVRTKFFRFMLLLRKATQHINRNKFTWVPDMETYDKEWTDTELYGMFNLTDDEQAYIETKIKPLGE